jgi:hypothetical protein
VIISLLSEVGARIKLDLRSQVEVALESAVCNLDIACELWFAYAAAVGPDSYHLALSRSLMCLRRIDDEEVRLDAFRKMMSWDYITQDYLRKLSWAGV